MEEELAKAREKQNSVGSVVTTTKEGEGSCKEKRVVVIS